MVWSMVWSMYVYVYPYVAREYGTCSRYGDVLRWSKRGYGMGYGIAGIWVYPGNGVYPGMHGILESTD